MEIDPLQVSSKEVYFAMTATIVPRPIAWVSTMSSEGTLNLAPFSFFTGVSSKPPTIVFCLGNRPDGTPKDTLTNIEARGEFVVNVVHEPMAQAMVHTSAPFAPGVSEFEQAGLDTSPSTRITVPRVKGSPVSYECTLNQVVELSSGGAVTSRMVVGNIVYMHIQDTVLDARGRVDVHKLRPVCRLGGKAYAMLDESFEIPHPKR